MTKTRRALADGVPGWMPRTFIFGAVTVVAVSVVISILRQRGDATPAAEPQPAGVDEEAPPQAQSAAVDDLPALPSSANAREAAEHTRIRHLVTQYREAVVTGADARAGALVDLIVREGEIATPFVDRAIAESGNARVRDSLTRLRGRLPEAIVITDPIHGPPTR